LNLLVSSNDRVGVSQSSQIYQDVIRIRTAAGNLVIDLYKKHGDCVIKLTDNNPVIIQLIKEAFPPKNTLNMTMNNNCGQQDVWSLLNKM